MLMRLLVGSGGFSSGFGASFSVSFSSFSKGSGSGCASTFGSGFGGSGLGSVFWINSSRGFESGGWFGWYGPAGMPQAVIERIYADARRVISVPAFKEKFITAGGHELVAAPGSSVPALIERQRKAFAAKIKDYRDAVQKLTTDPEKKEGLDELFAKGKALEAERDVALRKDPYFDWSQALLQIAIVLASVHLIIGNMTLLGLSAGLAGLGVLLMLNGFTLLLRLPFLG